MILQLVQMEFMQVLEEPQLMYITESQQGGCVLQIVTYKIHTVLKDTSLAGDVDEQDDEAFIRSLKDKNPLRAA